MYSKGPWRKVQGKESRIIRNVLTQYPIGKTCIED